jgi:fatty acid desaturase
LTTVAIAVAWRRWPSSVSFAVVAGACVYGYALAYILLFFHEAAHYNIARDRARNDRLANVFIGLLVGQSIGDYRPIHFNHHRYLGTPLDAERTYFDPLNVQFLIELLVGIRTMRVLAQRDKMARPEPSAESGSGTSRSQLVVGALLNGGVVATAIATGLWPIALAWAIGVVIVFPALAAIRQLLEHRDEYARSDVDYTVVPHGAINRMFGAGVFASTFGGAGFNRHLLHHWEPQISCTRLGELEDYLLDTPVARLMNQRRTSYASTFIRLFKRANGR